MELQSILQAIQDARLAVLIRESGSAFPILESLHVIGIAIVFGTIAIVDLRLIGYAAHRRSARRLIQELLPYTWLAFALCVLTGLLMFVSNATAYAHNPYFWWKMGVIFLAGVNMALFHLGAYRRIGEWDTALPAPSQARAAGLGSLTLWTAIVFLGRWIGFA